MTSVHILRSTAAAMAVILAAAGAWAQPSAYFVWKHKLSGKTMCEPDADGAQWTKVSGPYDDSHCKQLSPK